MEQNSEVVLEAVPDSLTGPDRKFRSSSNHRALRTHSRPRRSAAARFRSTAFTAWSRGRKPIPGLPARRHDRGRAVLIDAGRLESCGRQAR